MKADEAITYLENLIRNSPYGSDIWQQDKQIVGIINVIEQQLQLIDINKLLPDNYSESKCWKNGNILERIEWLKTMLEAKKEEVKNLERILFETCRQK